MAEEKTNQVVAELGNMVDTTGKIVSNASGIFTKLSEAMASAGGAAETLGIDLSTTLPGLESVTQSMLWHGRCNGELLEADSVPQQE
ncbi:MAG: hypothetical protein ACLTM8_10815 [Veillonella parvula]